MNTHKQIPITNKNFSSSYFLIQKLTLMIVFLSGAILHPIQPVKSEDLFLKCTGKFEINRGELIKPDWEMIYLRINLNGLKSTIDDKGKKIQGRTLIRRNYYTITHRDPRNKINATYKIHATHSTYMVFYPKQNRTLLGTCQKGRG